MTAMDTILSGKPYQLKGMILGGANPALTNPNSNKVIKALKSLELFVVRDIFMSETAELADYVLPGASFLEQSELHCHPIHHILSLSNKIVSFPHCDDEYTFWKKLSSRLGVEHYFPWRDREELNAWLLKDSGITMQNLLDHPEGYEFKPRRYQKYKTDGLPTPSGKFEFVSTYLEGYGYPGLPEYVPPRYKTSPNPEYPYVLVTGARKVFYTHGRNRNFKRCRTAIPDPDIEMNPIDADKLGVKSGGTWLR